MKALDLRIQKIRRNPLRWCLFFGRHTTDWNPVWTSTLGSNMYKEVSANNSSGILRTRSRQQIKQHLFTCDCRLEINLQFHCSMLSAKLRMSLDWLLSTRLFFFARNGYVVHNPADRQSRRPWRHRRSRTSSTEKKHYRGTIVRMSKQYLAHPNRKTCPAREKHPSFPVRLHCEDGRSFLSTHYC